MARYIPSLHGLRWTFMLRDRRLANQGDRKRRLSLGGGGGLGGVRGVEMAAFEEKEEEGVEV